MNTIVQNAGTASVISEKSISLTLESINTPTKIKAGDVAALGIIVTIGANIIDAKNIKAVVRAVSPVRPPAAIPELDSTRVVTVDVPTNAPVAVDMASDNKASYILITSPNSSTRPDSFAAASNVP